jgi:hypothetical protein
MCNFFAARRFLLSFHGALRSFYSGSAAFDPPLIMRHLPTLFGGAPLAVYVYPGGIERMAASGFIES